jgi:hypothetical protein
MRSELKFRSWIACPFELASSTAKPATISFDSTNGPSVTVIWPAADRTRAPSALGRQPSVATSQPDLMPSSTRVCILATYSGLGGVLVSVLPAFPLSPDKSNEGSVPALELGEISRAGRARGAWRS